MTPRRPYWILLAFSVVVLAVYLALPTSTYYWDGVGFALGIEHPEWFGDTLVKPNHLLYMPFGRAAYVLGQQLGLDLRGIPVLQVLNGIAAAACVFVLGAIILDWSGSTFMTLMAAALLAFSATWWKFSTDADAYIVPTLFLTLAFRFILPWQPVRPLSVAALHSAAMLFHQLAVLFWPAAVVGVYLQTTGRLRRGLAVLTYCIAAFIMTATPYLLSASRAGDLTARRFAEWITYHTPDSHFTFAGANIARVAEGHVKLLAGGRWTLARRFQGWPTGVALLLLAAFAVTMVRRPELAPDDAAPGWRDTRAMAVLALVWIAPFFAFLCFWLPQNTFYRLLYLPALILLLAATAVQRGWILSADGRRAMAIGVAVLAVWNFCLFIYPNAQEDANPVLIAARQLHAKLRKDAMIYVAVFTADDWLAMYENPQTRWMGLSRFDAATLQHDVNEAAGQGRDVWLDGSALERLERQAGGPDWLARHTDQIFDIKRSGHEIRFAQVHP